MNYFDFRKTYAWTLKQYPGTRELYQDNFCFAVIGKVKTERFEKRGKKWEIVSTETEKCTPYYYFNTVDAIPFFRRLGGNERISCGYCVRGYVPLQIVSTSPDKLSKTVRTFKLF